ncbi:MAG: hypothetical protein AMXMBFR46_04540 [Acidimicrobiia bacterium]
MTTSAELDAPQPEFAEERSTASTAPGRVARAGAWLSARQSWWFRLDDWLGLVILAACCVYVFVQLQPELVLRDSTPAGGDMGAHVWWPAFLRDHLLPWRVAGWSPDFYAGFPAGQYYFPVPALAIVGLDGFVPYNVAFKLVVVLGPVLVPAGAYVFAKGIRAPNPTPAAFAVAVTSFLFFTGAPGESEAAKAIAFNQRIMGGNLASTLAGEFSFTLAIAFALFFFGTLAAALRAERRLWLPAVLLALCLLSHLVVGIFAGIGAFAVWLFRRPLANLGRAVAIGGTGVLLSAFWVLPLLATMPYTTNMRYGPIGLDAPAGQGFTDYLFPSYFFGFDGWQPYRWGAYLLCAVAIVAAIGMLRRSTFVVLVLTAVCGLAFRFWTDLGTHVWNLRLLSFWYIGVHLLMAVGVAELIRGAGWLAGRGWRAVEDSRARVALDLLPDPPPTAVGPDGASGPAAAAVGPDGASGPPPTTVGPDGASGLEAATVGPDGVPGGPPAPVARGRSVAERATALAVMLALTAALAIGAMAQIDDAKGFLPYWAKWNFSGYENTENEISGTYSAPCATGGSSLATIPADDGNPPLCVYENIVAVGKQWPEYRALLDALAELPPGRSLWEGGPSVDKYGTPLALMLIPYWTHGRITTMEGVYFEASATTPYHFETVAALVAPGEGSNPVRGIPYRDQQSFDIGVRYLQALGVNYFIAHNPVTKAKADADARLLRVATSPDRDGAAPLGWSIYRVADAPLVQGLAYEPVIAEGVPPDPDGWEQQIAVPWWWFPDQLDRPVVADGPDGWRRADGAEALTLARRAIRPAKVRNVEAGTSSISFEVDRVGVPVLVKASYFPNWRVDGAEGPYRATPNFMVVVPTEKHVTLRYGTTPAEWLGRLLTLVGIAGLGALVWWGRRHRAEAGRATNPGDADPATTMAGSPGA